jgi:hypothetical protein
MLLDKNKITLLSILFALLFLCSGCTTSNITTNSDNKIATTSPFPVISAPTKAYFGDNIEFDATNSYDTDGAIKSYVWYFGDGTKAEGEKAEHKFEFLDEYNIRYPLVYTVSLIVKDDDNNKVARLHQIGLYPKKYSFFLTTGKITSIKPTSYRDTMHSTGLSKMGLQPYITYDFEGPTPLQKCAWSATIFLEKPLLSIVTKIIITFYDVNGEEIAQKEQRLGLNNFWRTKKIEAKGTFEKDIEIKTVKISVPNFSINNKIYVLYGDEKPSGLCFDFINN